MIKYYIVQTGNEWDVIREGQPEGFDWFIGTYNDLKWAEEAVSAYIELSGGEKYEK